MAPIMRLLKAKRILYMRAINNKKIMKMNRIKLQQLRVRVKKRRSKNEKSDKIRSSVFQYSGLNKIFGF